MLWIWWISYLSSIPKQINGQLETSKLFYFFDTSSFISLDIKIKYPIKDIIINDFPIVQKVHS